MRRATMVMILMTEVAGPTTRMVPMTDISQTDTIRKMVKTEMKQVTWRKAAGPMIVTSQI